MATISSASLHVPAHSRAGQTKPLPELRAFLRDKEAALKTLTPAPRFITVLAGLIVDLAVGLLVLLFDVIAVVHIDHGSRRARGAGPSE